MATRSENQFLKFLSRALFPSWRFFGEIGHVPRLLYRKALSEDEFGPWQVLWSKQQRHWWNLFFNPQGNLHLAVQTLLERSLEELSSAADGPDGGFEDLVSYGLLLRSVRAGADFADGERFQFKIAVVSQESESIVEDLMLSTIHEVGAI